MKISVVAPLYNSESYIGELCARCIKDIREAGAVDHEIILVNDGSPDGSLAAAKAVAASRPGIVVIDLARNYGQHKAIMTGLKYATGDYVFVIDSDLEEDPAWIGSFYRELSTHSCDVVYGVSKNKKGRWLYGVARSGFYRLLNVLSGVSFPTDITNARLMTRRYVDALLLFEERELFLGGLWHIAGFHQRAVAVEKQQRGRSNYTTRRLFSLALNGITGFSTRPLIAIAVVGLFSSLVSLLLMLWVLAQKFIYGVEVEGWVSLMVVVLFIGSLQLFVTGIVAIYISKIFLEVKQRPLTIVRDVIRSREMQ